MSAIAALTLMPVSIISSWLGQIDVFSHCTVSSITCFIYSSLLLSVSVWFAPLFIVSSGFRVPLVVFCLSLCLPYCSFAHLSLLFFVFVFFFFYTIYNAYKACLWIARVNQSTWRKPWIIQRACKVHTHMAKAGVLIPHPWRCEANVLTSRWISYTKLIQGVNVCVM